ncbi:AhpC-TSA-domain-containing protein [Sistotremastrum suecicum HHB10207 ss-3]|uniref:thioredoxin-dependent peroxiredoxin n=1 Tax=Sistotremastrum suecicum HHB10207 ss-3 TaxID=1314776 RepID=A0A166A767_9AGAM|nr:AhpC-TSA-domain-containing protein [Sistotremastrum suecicum HHB10207 ss-3]
MPRKAAVTSSETPAEPRRSTRVASLPKPEEPIKKPAKKSSGEKRTASDKADAGEGAGEESAAKKAKTTPDDSEEKDQLKDDEDEDAVQKPELTPINIGDSLPDITLKNEKDEDIKIAELAAEKGVIFFLVPKADTSGCTTQACGFRDSYPDFTGLDYTVYCLSADPPSAQLKWQTKKHLPYPLISDKKRVLITALGAGKNGKTARSHFIFEKGGKLIEKKQPVKPAESPVLALAFIKGLSEKDS